MNHQEPAFSNPGCFFVGANNEPRQIHPPADGLTKLEYASIKMMASLNANPSTVDYATDCINNKGITYQQVDARLAQRAVEIAKSLLAELEKEKQ